MSDISIHSNDEHFHCYQNITPYDCSDWASRAGGKDSEEGVFDKSALPKFMRKQRHVTTQLHTFLGLYSARLANAASFRGG
jgi:hypothetical protein